MATRKKKSVTAEESASPEVSKVNNPNIATKAEELTNNEPSEALETASSIEDSRDLKLEVIADSEEVSSTPEHLPTASLSTGLELQLSDSLVRKLREQAADEGLSLEDYVEELLAESVVLRAWEIVEKKLQLRGNNPQQGNQQHQGNRGNHRGGNNNGNNNNRQNRNNNHRRGMNHQRYQAIMDDKATFLEYVRNQERKQGR